MYENKKILILGAAKSGVAVAKLLVGKNNEIILSDLKELPSSTAQELEDMGIKIMITLNQCDLIDSSYDLVIKNPAIMMTSEITKKLNKLHIRTENEMEVAYHFLPENVTIIGVTGSNGKTTTTTIIYELLKRLNINVIFGCNICYPLSEFIKGVQKESVLLLEISDHQLCDIHDFKTNISVITNLCPTHLDYHGSYENYKKAKKKIFNLHTSNDLAILNHANEDCLELSKDILSKKVYFNNFENYYDNNYIYLHGEKYLNINNICLQGEHNYENILAALLVVEQFGLDKDIVVDFLKTFSGVEHRLEYVANKNGIEYYNDSKSTNPTATITALKTFTKPIHLILGGLDRNQDFNELNDYINYVKKIYAIGEVTDKVANYASNLNIPCERCYNLVTAMEKIHQNVQRGDVVLLSPGSSSQDQYVKFEDRGDEFKNIVENF